MGDGNSSVKDGAENVETRGYSAVERLSQFVDQHKQRVSLCLFAVMGAGAALAVRSLKISHQFTSVRDIPSDFTRKNVSIFGFVGRVELKERERRLLPYLYVSHIPIFGKINKSIETQIPVRLIGVDINKDHLTSSESLLDNLTNSKVKVKLLDKSDEELFGQVFKKKYGIWADCVGQTLLRNGFGEYSSSDMKNTMFNKNMLKYETQLLKGEKYARRKKVGMWQDPPGENQTRTQQVVGKVLRLLRLK